MVWPALSVGNGRSCSTGSSSSRAAVRASIMWQCVSVMPLRFATCNSIERVHTPRTSLRLSAFSSNCYLKKESYTATKVVQMEASVLLLVVQVS